MTRLALVVLLAAAGCAAPPSDPSGSTPTAAPALSAPEIVNGGVGFDATPSKAAPVGAAVAQAQTGVSATVMHVAAVAQAPVWQHPLPGSCRPPWGGGHYLAPRSGYRHQGIDLGGLERMPVGTPVRSIGGGVVTSVGWHGNAGLQVQVVIGLGHPDAVTFKANHLQSVWVRRGQWVQPGQAIGGMGATGNTSGPHLHAEVWRWGGHRDPVAFLRSVGVEIGCG